MGEKDINQENSRPSPKRHNTKVLFLLIIAIVAAAVGIVCGLSMSKKKASENYEDNLTDIDSTMLAGAAKSESIAGMIRDIWYDSIFDEESDKTRIYTDGATDFNDAVSKYQGSKEYKDGVNDINNDIKKVNDLIKKLQNPPDKYKDAYSDLKEYYNDFLSFTDLALNPSGTLTTYTDKYNDLDSKLSSEHTSFQIYLE